MTNNNWIRADWNFEDRMKKLVIGHRKLFAEKQIPPVTNDPLVMELWAKKVIAFYRPELSTMEDGCPVFSGQIIYLGLFAPGGMEVQFFCTHHLFPVMAMDELYGNGERLELCPICRKPLPAIGYTSMVVRGDFYHVTEFCSRECAAACPSVVHNGPFSVTMPLKELKK